METTTSRRNTYAFVHCLVAVGALAGCDTVNGNGHLTSEQRTLAVFEALDVSAGLEVHFTEGPQQVLVEGDANIVPWVFTESANGVLRIWPRHDLRPSLPLNIEVSTLSIQRAALHGGGRIDLAVGAVESLTLDVEAGGTMVARGEASHLEARVSAGGSLDARALPAHRVKLVGEAGGELEVQVSEAVEGTITSGSIATIYGQPTVREVVIESGGEVHFE